MTAVQGQDFPGAVTSVALRTAGRRREDVLAALDAGAVVRSWPMRGTLHLVAAEDLPWMLELLGPRALARLAGRRANLGLTEADAEGARELAVAALSGRQRLFRAALLAALTAGGVDVSGQRGYHLLWFLAQTARSGTGDLAGDAVLRLRAVLHRDLVGVRAGSPPRPDRSVRRPSRRPSRRRRRTRPA